MLIQHISLLLFCLRSVTLQNGIIICIVDHWRLDYGSILLLEDIRDPHAHFLRDLLFFSFLTHGRRTTLDMTSYYFEVLAPLCRFFGQL